MNVLLVDDETDFLTILGKRLARRSIRVTLAESGEQALERMAAAAPPKDFDVVVMDIRMPGMGGLKALSRMREDYPDTPVILLTAHTDMDDAMTGLESGAFCHLVKPVDLNTIIWRLQDAHRARLLAQDETRARNHESQGPSGPRQTLSNHGNNKEMHE